MSRETARLPFAKDTDARLTPTIPSIAERMVGAHSPAPEAFDQMIIMSEIAVFHRRTCLSPNRGIRTGARAFQILTEAYPAFSK